MRIRIPHISKEASHYITLEQGFNDYIRDVNKLSVRLRVCAGDQPLKLGTAIHGGQRHSFREDIEEGKSHVSHGGIEREVSNP